MFCHTACKPTLGFLCPHPYSSPDRIGPMPPSLKKVKFRHHILGYIVLNRDKDSTYMLWLVTSHVKSEAASWFECFETNSTFNVHIFQVVCFHVIFNVGWELWCLSTLHTLPNRGVVHIKGFYHEGLNQSFNVCSTIWLSLVWLLYLWAVISVLVCRSNVKRQSSTGFKRLKAEVTF